MSDSTAEYWQEKLAEEDAEFMEALENLAELQRATRADVVDLRDTIQGWERARAAVMEDRAQLIEELRVQRESDRSGASSAAKARAKESRGLLDRWLVSLNVASLAPALICTKKVVAALRPKKGGIVSTSPGAGSGADAEGRTPTATSPSDSEGRRRSEPLISPTQSPGAQQTPAVTVAQLAAAAQHITKLRRVKSITIALSPTEEQGVMQKKAKAAKKLLGKSSSSSGAKTPPAADDYSNSGRRPSGSTLPVLETQLAIRAMNAPHAPPAGTPPRPSSPLVLVAVTLSLGGSEPLDTVFAAGEGDAKATVADEYRDRALQAVRAEIDRLISASPELSPETRRLIGSLTEGLDLVVCNTASSDGSQRTVDVEVRLRDAETIIARLASPSSEVSLIGLLNTVAEHLVGELLRQTPDTQQGSRRLRLVGDGGRAALEGIEALIRDSDLSSHDGYLLAFALAQKDAAIRAECSTELPSLFAPPILWQRPADVLWECVSLPVLHLLADPPAAPTRLRKANIALENVPNELLQGLNKIANGEKRKLPKGMETGPLSVSTKTKISLALNVYDQLHIDVLRPFGSGEADRDVPLEPYVIYANKEIRERAAYILQNFSGSKVASGIEATLEPTQSGGESKPEVALNDDDDEGLAQLARAAAAAGESSEVADALSRTKTQLQQRNLARLLKRVERLQVSVVVPSPFSCCVAPSPSVSPTSTPTLSAATVAPESTALLSPVYIGVDVSIAGLRQWIRDEDIPSVIVPQQA